jgi:hypothetical protein
MLATLADKDSVGSGLAINKQVKWDALQMKDSDLLAHSPHIAYDPFIWQGRSR